MQLEGTSLPFAIIDRVSGRAIGSTRYGNINRQHRKVEIGWTRVGHRWLRTGVNTGTKNLLLSHALETRHFFTQAGRIRETVYYSIIDSEWPRVKASLEQKVYTSR